LGLQNLDVRVDGAHATANKDTMQHKHKHEPSNQRRVQIFALQALGKPEHNMMFDGWCVASLFNTPRKQTMRKHNVPKDIVLDSMHTGIARRIAKHVGLQKKAR
jgi:hypothetical protein